MGDETFRDFGGAISFQPRRRGRRLAEKSGFRSSTVSSTQSSSSSTGFAFGSAVKTPPVCTLSSPKATSGQSLFSASSAAIPCESLCGAFSAAIPGPSFFGASSAAMIPGQSFFCASPAAIPGQSFAAPAVCSFGVSSFGVSAASSATESSPITFFSSSISNFNAPPASISNSNPTSASTAASIGDSKPSIFAPVENSKPLASDSKPDSSSSPAKNSSNSSSSKTSKSPSSSSPELEKESRLPLIVVSRIINGIPQSPHFYQFRNLSQRTRASLISSLDFVYEDTVNQLHNLQVENFWIKANEMWRTMEDLQSMGYNVIALRRRLVELSDVMMERRLAEGKIEEMKIRGEDHRMEKSRLDFLILSLRKMAEEEEKRMQGVFAEATKREKELPMFDDEFVKLAMKQL